MLLCHQWGLPTPLPNRLNNSMLIAHEVHSQTFLFSFGNCDYPNLIMLKFSKLSFEATYTPPRSGWPPFESEFTTYKGKIHL